MTTANSMNKYLFDVAQERNETKPPGRKVIHVTTFKCHPLSGPPALQDLGVFSLFWLSKHVGIGYVCSLTSVHSLSGHWLVLIRY